MLQQRVYRSRIRDVDHLKQRLIEEWRCFDQNITDQVVRQWRVRLCTWAKIPQGFWGLSLPTEKKHFTGR